MKASFSDGAPPLITDEQFVIAIKHLEGEEESLVELLNMKIASDLYQGLLSNQNPRLVIEDTLNKAVHKGLLVDNSINSSDTKHRKPWYHKGRW